MNRKRLKQHERPQTFPNLWQVGGWYDEHPHAMKLCEVIGYTTSRTGQERVRVRFVDRKDLFEPETAQLSPHMLFPVRPEERKSPAV